MAVTFFHTLKSFSQFLWNFKLAGSPLVDQNTANIRAAICATCHNNKPSGDVRKTGCAICGKMSNKALGKIRTDIIGNSLTTSDSALLACGICGCDLRLSVWIPNKILLTKEDANAYPEFCFKKAILRDADL